LTKTKQPSAVIANERWKLHSIVRIAVSML
jgi:hypothetical protein